MSSVIVIAFFSYMLYCLVRGYNSPEEYRFKRNLDFFELGYIEEGTPTILYVEKPKKIKKPKAEKPKAEKPKVAKPKVEKPKKHPLFDDCCLALKSLGYKASQAKTVCVQIFSNNDITSIQQFIRIASNL